MNAGTNDNYQLYAYDYHVKLHHPVLKAQGRGGWGVSFNLSYNSQNWRQDPANT